MEKGTFSTMREVSPHLAPYAGKLRVRVCGICLHERKVLVVQHRATVGNAAFWAPPGGGITFGESLRQGLVRELAEETGLDVTPGKFLGVNELIQEPLHALEFFLEAHLQGGTLRTGLDPEVSENQQLIERVQFMSLAELNRIPRRDLHPILRDLTHLDDLLLPRNWFKA